MPEKKSQKLIKISKEGHTELTRENLCRKLVSMLMEESHVSEPYNFYKDATQYEVLRGNKWIGCIEIRENYRDKTPAGYTFTIWAKKFPNADYLSKILNSIEGLTMQEDAGPQSKPESLRMRGMI